MQEKATTIAGIPAAVFGDPIDRVFFYVHGRCGSKEDARDLATLICPQGWQVVSFDLPEHGERKEQPEKLVPWQVIPELHTLLAAVRQHWQTVALYANSIGAWFSLLAFPEESFSSCLLVSPVVDMPALIKNMMFWANVTPEQLEQQGEIATNFGETLSWRYKTFAEAHPLNAWASSTAVLYAAHDNLTDRQTITAFAERLSCRLTVYEDGEHWFHTPEQLTVLHRWVKEEMN